MSNPYLPLKWSCSLHNERPSLRVIGFDHNGDVYVEGDCPHDGHEVAMTIALAEWAELALRSRDLIRQALDPTELPIEEEEIDEFDADAFWDEQGDGA